MVQPMTVIIDMALLECIHAPFFNGFSAVDLSPFKVE